MTRSYPGNERAKRYRRMNPPTSGLSRIKLKHIPNGRTARPRRAPHLQRIRNTAATQKSRNNGVKTIDASWRSGEGRAAKSASATNQSPPTSRAPVSNLSSRPPRSPPPAGADSPGLPSLNQPDIRGRESKRIATLSGTQTLCLRIQINNNGVPLSTLESQLITRRRATCASVRSAGTPCGRRSIQAGRG